MIGGKITRRDARVAGDVLELTCDEVLALQIEAYRYFRGDVKTSKFIELLRDYGCTPMDMAEIIEAIQENRP